uniref:Multifunctional fusion protein n=1 Tax=Heterodera avenae TaxID=34510 RepID=A0A2L0VDJ6_HETAV|nr:putative effector protein [Heterodera avenae]
MFLWSLPFVRPIPLCLLRRSATSFTGLTSEQFMKNPTNEPVLEYRKGSQENGALEKELQKLWAEPMEVPLCIGKQKTFRKENAIKQPMPFDHSRPVALFNHATAEDIRNAIQIGLVARQQWERLPLIKRADIFLHAADLVAGKYRMLLNAATMLGQAKNVQQAEIDAACELADFLRFNAYFALQNAKYQPISGNGYEDSMLLRGLEGFIAAIAPFNFTAIGGNLASAPALMGNVVMWKPSDTAVASNFVAYQIFEEAGLPPGVISFLPSDGPTFGNTVTDSKELAGINFTGSVPTFQQLWRRVSDNLTTYDTFPRLIGECGGKNFHFIHPSADVPSVVACTHRAAFEYQGQKCSACARMFVPKSLWPSIQNGLSELASLIKMGDARDRSVFMSAVIDAKAFKRISDYIAYAKGVGVKQDGTQLIFGGKCDDSRGWFIEPTCVEVKSLSSRLLKQEIFGPFLAVYVYNDEEAEQLVSSLKEQTPYGLTGAVFSQDKQFLYKAKDILRDAVGNLYLNDKCTGSVVGQQPFGGARQSGTNDKAGGPHYVLRWASAQVIKESFVPLTEWRYPHMD